MPPPVPEPSALATLLKTHTPPGLSADGTALHHLALQVAHNLKYQQSWTSLRIHYPNQPASVSKSHSPPPPRPLISGLPPKRLYVHPDEQIEYLQRQHEASAGNTKTETGAPSLSDDLPAEREWVLPCHLREKWSLQRMAGVFDSVPRCVPLLSGNDDELEDWEGVLFGDDDDPADGETGETNEWRMKMPKRLLMAILEDDSTVVYYIVHDGVVKPRQN